MERSSLSLCFAAACLGARAAAGQEVVLTLESALERARTHSLVRAARSSNGMPSAANSSASQPTPIPRMARPPESTSSVAASLAT